jgi:hypothetical protein
MRESNRRVRRRSKTIKEEKFPKSSLFGRCVIQATDGIKPAQWLATKISCTERHANLLIEGRCKPSARALNALNTEILDRG